ATDQLRDLDIHRSLKHTTGPVQNTDFRKSEKLLLSEKSTGTRSASLFLQTSLWQSLFAI
ncbi:hypothetical protein OTG62_27520, partial [Escherichia coli]|uniref:hypothetical protein n=1 Tax=Escherichia coli TaxID=562 RepID=UPI002263EAF4